MMFSNAVLSLLGVASTFYLASANAAISSSTNSTSAFLRGGGRNQQPLDRGLIFTQASPDDFMLFEINDAKHDNSIVAGDAYDGNLYHQSPDYRMNAKWFFYPVPNHPGYYYIIDAKHKRGIVSGINYDNHVYHQDVWDRDAAMWKVEPSRLPNTEGYYTFTDMRHERSIVAGDVYDAHLYHQYVDGRRNGIWRLTLVMNPDKPGPGFMIKSEQVMHMDYLTGPVVQNVPVVFSRREVDNLSANGTIQHTFSFDRTITTSESLTMTSSTTKGMSVAITDTIGISEGPAKASISASVSEHWSQTDSTSNTHKRQVTTSITSTSTFSIPPRNHCIATFTMFMETKDIPFIAQTMETFMDNHNETKPVTGVWRATQFVGGTTAMECTEL